MIGEAWYTGNGTANSNIVEEFAEDGGYTKLREISITYAMDNAAVRRMGFSSIDIRVAGQESAHLDEVQWPRSGDQSRRRVGILQGYDFFNMPQTRSFVFSIGLNR